MARKIAREQFLAFYDAEGSEAIMTTTVFLLGARANVIEDVRAQLDGSGIEIRSGTSLDELRAAFAEASVDHVIMGSGLDLEVRLRAVRAVFETSNGTTVHMKDWNSGPEGYLPFVQAVLGGLHGSS
ncbi:MAG: hypothetical protein JWN03_3559 [Nocardia sp.]|uniref:hypothetical protein n=1 Tax=Nocardia sp. TaxID=1821 RepID=UPI0026362692|nr:hypothetical protein [Nocardia sp.]MCU1643284.1 hypothetical protein [Nocardia sp.]